MLGASRDAGATWQTTSLQIPGFNRLTAYVQRDVAYVWLAWANVLFTTDGGSSWNALPGIVHTAFSPGPRRNVNVAWDAASVDSMFAYVASGWTELGPGTPGTGGLVPHLSVEGLTVQGHTFTMDVDQMLPASVAAMALTVPAVAPQRPTPIQLGSASDGLCRARSAGTVRPCRNPSRSWSARSACSRSRPPASARCWVPRSTCCRS